MENEEKRMISSYEVTQSIHIGRKEVVFGVDEKAEYPFLVCHCTYDNPLSAEWVTDDWFMGASCNNQIGRAHV